MNKKVIIAVAAVLVVVIGIILAVSIGKGNKVGDNAETESVSENGVSEPGTEPGSETGESESIVIDTNVPNSTIGHLNPDGQFEYNVVKSERILAEESSENDDYTWEYTVMSYEENDKIQFVGIYMNAKETSDSADAEVVIDYDTMTYTCDVVYRVGEDVERISFEGDAESYNPVTETISEKNRSGFDEIVKDVIYKMFH